MQGCPLSSHDSSRPLTMFHQIISFLLDVFAGLLGGACLLRLYMQMQYIGFANPVGRLVFALTDWLVLPLRRVVRAVGRLDTSSLLAAFLLEVGQFSALWVLFDSRSPFAAVLVLAVFGVVRLVLSGLTGLLIIYSILSWVGNRTPISDVIVRLCAPPLQPIRRLVPLVGGMDLSPLVLLVLLQVLTIMVGGLQAQILHAL